MAAALALGLVVVVIVVGALWWRGGQPEPVRLVVGPNRPVSAATGPASAQNSPSVVVNPTDPRSLVVAGRVDRPEFSAVVRFSRDEGRTWSDSRLALPPGQTRPFQPQLAFDAKGVLYILYSTLEGPGIRPNGLWLETSRDGGASFSSPVRVAERLTYQARLVVDQASAHVHVTWLQAGEGAKQGAAPPVDQSSPTLTGAGLGPPPNPVLMATSRDGGATFPTRAQVSDPRRRRVGAASPVIAPGGDIFVLYQDYGSDVADFEGLPGEVHEGTFSLVVGRSRDGGATFSDTGVAENSVVASERFVVFLPKFPSLAVDPRDAALYVAWSDIRNGDADVFVRRSGDRGRTWTSPIRVDNADDSPRQQQYLPKIAVAPDGRVDVLFLDRDDRSENVRTTAVLSTSVDKGATWDAVTVSDQAFDSLAGTRIEPRDPDPRIAETGTNLGLVSTVGEVYAVWADSRRGSAERGQDLIAAPVRVVRG